ncbi:MAG: hypothetical protein GXP37_14210 [Chloroflexi bacterium]|nr:hypothetical protein [Chloroflexota bacterium]
MRKKIDLPWQISIIIFAVVFLLGFGFLNALSSPPPESAPRDQWKTVTHELYGFSLDYPPGWLAETYGESGFKGNRAVKLRITRGFAGTVFMRVYYQAAINPTLENVARWGQYASGTLRSGNATIISFEQAELNGYEVAKRTYRSTNIYQDVYIAREKDMIIIKLQAQDRDFWDFLPIFDEIVASFRPMY